MPLSLSLRSLLASLLSAVPGGRGESKMSPEWTMKSTRSPSIASRASSRAP
ncbi:MAG: hypothetical protein RXS42_06985 [Nitrososphaeria archaeon]